MTQKSENRGKALMVTYTASVYYDRFDVEEFDLTEDAAIENLLDGVRREPSNFGELEVEWIEE